MARSKQGKGTVQEEHTLVFTEDGKVATWWWTPESDQILSTLGPPAPGFEMVNGNKWCG
jgi:hypothetical protein